MLVKFDFEYSSLRGLNETVNRDDIELVQCCYDAINEGGADSEFLKTAVKYTQSIVFSILEETHKTLLKIYASIISLYNSYMINNVRLVEKYRELIFSKLQYLENPIQYEYYTFPYLFEFPNVIKKDPNDARIILKTIEDIVFKKNTEYSSASEYVEEKVIEFGKEVLDTTIDPNNIDASIKQICDRKLLGEKTTRSLSKSNFDKFFKELMSAKKQKKSIDGLKKEIDSYYIVLRKQFSDTFNTKTSDGLSFRIMYGKAIPISKEDASKITRADMERNKLFNSYMMIYRSVFNYKLNIIQKKIQQDSKILTELMKRASVLANVAKSSNVTRELEKDIKL